MNNNKGQRTLAIWALVIALLSTTIAYAVLQTTLTISGSITKKGGSWSISFVDVAHVAGETLTTYPSTSGTNLNFAVTLNEPGDYTVIGFKVKNSGSIIANANYYYNLNVGSNSALTFAESWGNAVTDNGISCILSDNASGTSQTVNKVMDKINIVGPGQTTEMVYLKCRYDDITDSEDLPESDSTISVNFRINYQQA